MVEKLMGGEAAGIGVEALSGIVLAMVSTVVAVATAVEVIVRTMVVGVGISVSTIVESRVVTSILVVGGSVDAGAMTVVVAAAAPDEPPSTATTEYDGVCRRISRSIGDAWDRSMGSDTAETAREENFIMRGRAIDAMERRKK
jgi:hypothetical protein